MASMPCVRAVSCLHVVMTRLRSSSKGESAGMRAGICADMRVGRSHGQVAVVHRGLRRPCVEPCVGCHSGGGDSDARSSIVKAGV